MKAAIGREGCAPIAVRCRRDPRRPTPTTSGGAARSIAVRCRRDLRRPSAENLGRRGTEYRGSMPERSSTAKRRRPRAARHGASRFDAGEIFDGQAPTTSSGAARSIAVRCRRDLRRAERRRPRAARHGASRFDAGEIFDGPSADDLGRRGTEHHGSMSERSSTAPATSGRRGIKHHGSMPERSS